jgi:hypothetical protein
MLAYNVLALLRSRIFKRWIVAPGRYGAPASSAAAERSRTRSFGRTRRASERIFREHGLPRAILSGNGSQFGSPGLTRLSRLSLWWIRLGISIERIVPGHPEQNGAHERQQKRFDEFRHVYGYERPHEASARSGRRPSTAPRRDPIRSRCRRSSTPAIWRLGRSDTTE